MPEFKTHDGLTLHYTDTGSGRPTLLLHGFAADANLNWEAPGIASACVDAGCRVIAPDARGHGRSAKPHDPEAYAGDAMTRDVSALIDHLGLEQVDVVGYSMGAITAQAAAMRDSRIRRAVLGGIGGRLLHEDEEEGRDPTAIADALDAEDAAAVNSPVAKAFRAFAESTGADLRALAAVQRARRDRSPPEEPLSIPVLVVVGEGDVLVGSGAELAAFHSDATFVSVPGDHLGAVAQPELRDAIVEFLSRDA